MAEDFEDLYDLENMGDDELKDLVLQELSEYPELDVDLIEVSVRDGKVTLQGRVGTEAEIQQAEQVLTDVLGIDNISNELVLDEITRGERSEAADEAWAEDLAASTQMASEGPRTSDEAAHLMEDLDAEQFGTDVPQEAVERGTTYEPPDRPVQEGSSREQH
jgi:hypothetical protein